MERRLAAILSADLAGYSRLMAADEVGVLAAFKSIETDLFAPKSAEHGGRVVNHAGDGFLMEFASVTGAVNFAADIQQALAVRNAPMPPDARMEFRIGINIGDVIVDGEDIHGDGVNVAARLEALADPGGVLVSRTVADHVRGKVDCEFEALGARQLKNIPDPVEIHRMVLPGSVGIPAPGRKSMVRRYAMVGLLVAIATVVAIGLGPGLWQPPIEAAIEARMAFPLPDKPSIAVVPFNDLSEDTSQEHFADGMTEDLITDLSKISGLFVIARNSSFAYKGGPVSPKRVAEDLGVRYVLEGSVRRAGDRLRVNAQLIDATTGGHVWADRFDGGVADIFAVQDQFVLKIVDALALRLTDRERSEIEKVETRKIEAKAAFQRGWALYSRFNEQDNFRAIPHFKRAIELDPDYGRAYGALALVHLRPATFHHWSGGIGARGELRHHQFYPVYLNAAIKHDTSLIHVIRATMALNHRHTRSPLVTGGAIYEARIEAGHAIALQPNDPEAHITMAWALIVADQPEEALNFVKAAMRLDPNYPSHYVLFSAAARIALGDLETAADAVAEGLSRDPQATELLPIAAAVYAQLGRREDARAAIEKWKPGASQAELDEAAERYFFIVQWEGENLAINHRLQDGLRFAILPPEMTVDSLVADLDATDVREKLRAIQRLGLFRSGAAPAVPRLTQVLNGQKPLLRKAAAVALGKIGSGAAAAIPSLRQAADVPIVGYHAKIAIDRISEN